LAREPRNKAWEMKVHSKVVRMTVNQMEVASELR
jgi:hypothetical protein